MTINEIIKRIRADVITKLPDTKGLLRNSLLMVLIESISGVIYSLYSAIDIAKRDSTVLTATGSRLQGFGSIYGITRKSATKAEVTIKVTTNDLTIPVNSTFTDLSGNTYKPTEEATVASGFALVTIEADSFGYVEEPILIESSTYTDIEINSFIQSQDKETDTDYRSRILDRIQYPPSGGSAKDYERWLLECSGVTKAFVLPNRLEYGEVLLSYLINGNIPDGAFDDQYIKDYIDSNIPVTAKVRIEKPIPKVIDVSVKVNPDSSEIRNSVTTELGLMFQERSFNDSIFYKSFLSEAIARATGEDSHNILVPLGNVDIGEFEIPQLGTVTFI